MGGRAISLTTKRAEGTAGWSVVESDHQMSKPLKKSGSLQGYHLMEENSSTEEFTKKLLFKPSQTSARIPPQMIGRALSVMYASKTHDQLQHFVVKFFKDPTRDFRSSKSKIKQHVFKKKNDPQVLPTDPFGGFK